jgi:hypothetical protein
MVDPVVVSSRIERVQVFRRGAVITRLAVVDGTSLAGGADLEFVGLPLSLLDPSARVRIIGVGGGGGRPPPPPPPRPTPK